ncbi:MAG: GNAT family N-acetyltransferase [Methanobacteriota archaeon]|nr:MAG: GNAT family N-acetyltransferase [Euryarchaeota archaeon]
MAYQVRHAIESDIAAIALVSNESRRGEPAHRDKTPDELKDEIYEAVGFDPEGLWIVLQGSKPVGYANAIVEGVGEESIGYIIVEVVPSHRENGIEQELMTKALTFIESKGADRARSRAFEKDEWFKALLESLDFASDRRFFSMVCARGAPGNAFTPPEGVQFRHQLLNDAGDEDLSVLVEVLNESFREHYGWVPGTERQFESLRDSTEDIFRTTYATKDGRVIGFSLLEDSVVFNREHGAKEGWILAVGVLKDHRRMGVGRALIADCMRWFGEHGITTVRLGVDAENRKALDLYSSLGFEVAWENYIYEKRLASGGARA